MGGPTTQKIFATILVTALLILGIDTLMHSVGASDDHSGYAENDDECDAESSLTCWAKISFPGWHPEIADVAAEDGEEEIFDLGALLAVADPEAGARSFRAKCSTCHGVGPNSANGTGPKMYRIIEADIAGVPGFGYSSALQAREGVWTYQEMNDWLYNPSSHVRGTSMAFAGLRRDPERMNVIAYLASEEVSPNAPAFPDPLPAVIVEEGEAVAEEIDVDMTTAGGDVPGTSEDPIMATGEIVTQDAIDGADTTQGEDRFEEESGSSQGEVELVPGPVADGVPEIDGDVGDLGEDVIEDADLQEPSDRAGE